MDYQDLAKQDKLDRMRAVIGGLESSWGSNKKHTPMTSGPNAGQTAAGSYGMVPGTLKDVLKQRMNRGLENDPELNSLANEENPDVITENLNSNQELDRKAARHALELLAQKYDNDDAKILSAWRNGTNKKFKDDSYKDEDYVKTGLERLGNSKETPLPKQNLNFTEYLKGLFTK